jgi:hypothetical protein
MTAETACSGNAERFYIAAGMPIAGRTAQIPVAA